jgi:biotin carboxyl carrier protein
MPTYEILVDGEPRKVGLTAKGKNQFQIEVGDKLHEVTLQTETLSSGKSFEVRVDGKTYRVEFSKIEHEKPISIKVEEATFKTQIRPLQRQVATTFEPTPQAPNKKTILSRQGVVEGAVRAPMTGKIVSVKVKKGDNVKQNQILCVIEAMKMENEIAAPKMGIIEEVNVSEGLPVSEGDTLFVIA